METTAKQRENFQQSFTFEAVVLNKLKKCGVPSFPAPQRKSQWHHHCTRLQVAKRCEHILTDSVNYLLEQHIQKEKKYPSRVSSEAHTLCGLFIDVCALKESESIFPPPLYMTPEF